ncbi:MAG: hypothetical protein LWX08_09100 [Deltaproteobacteria bacterium]|jgi:hypothetical protein|nr:hypothetical protein [Deltaproteobacteria bacterium]
MRLDERLIEEKTTDGGIDFHEHILRVRKEASNWLEGIEKNGVEHSKRLEDYLNRLIPDEFKERLEPAEVFILLYAVYLHDIGYRNEQGEIESNNHPLRSKKYMLKDPRKYLFDRFPPMQKGEAPLAAQAVAEVCYGHAHESICPLRNISNNFGDSSFCYKFACDMTGSGYVPVVVELKTVMAEGWREVIQREVRSRAGDSTQSPVLILDGFDELSLTFDKETVLKEIENLSKTTQEYKKVILTSRTQFFRSEEEEKETLVQKKFPGRVPRSMTYPRFERIYVSLFDDEQIRRYLDLCLGKETSEKFWNETVEKVFDVKDLARRPILIELIVNDLDAVQNIAGKVTPGKVYHIVTERWQERERKEQRLPPYIELQHKEEKIPKNIMLFMEELAYWMLTKEKDPCYLPVYLTQKRPFFFKLK